MKFKVLLMVFMFMLSACGTMVWHEGSMIQYKEVKDLGERKYSIEVLGGWKHDQAILEKAVLIKAKSLCGGSAEILTSEMGDYYSAGAGGGVGFSGNPPKIISTIQCASNPS